MWLAEIERMRPLFDAWNERNQRAMDQYAALPFAICVGWVKDEDDEPTPCHNARGNKDTLCDPCRRAAAKRTRTAGGTT